MSSTPYVKSRIGQARQRLRMDGAGRVWLLNAFTVTAATVLYFTVLRQVPELSSPIDIPWWSLAIFFAGAEIFVVHLQIRRDAHSFSLSEMPLVIGLFFVSPTALVLAQLAGSLIALTIHRRQSPIKLIFNLSHFCLESSLAAIIFISVAGPLTNPIGIAGWMATFLATFVTTIVGVFMIFLAISLSEGRPQVKNLPQAMGLGLVVGGANTSLALIGVFILWKAPAALWLLLLPTATLFLAYQAYTSQREKHNSLEFLYETARILQSSPQVETGMLALLTRARTMFQAETAEIMLFPSNNNDATLRTSLGADDSIEVLQPVDLNPADGMWTRVTSKKEALLLGRNDRNESLADYLAERGIRDAMVAPLHGETRVIGTMLVGNRLGDVSTFDLEDIKLFETLANQASVSLEKGRLEQSLAQLTALEAKLKHQAFHDSLTNLANRALFTDRVEHALARQDRRSNPLAVLFLDLDDFKTINDSLGHAAGDQLLISVAERLHECLRPADTAARLGGDEFAILLEDMDDAEDATAVAERIIEDLGTPFVLQDKEVMVHASVGIAWSVSGREGAHELLRNADLAMYRAKNRGKGRYEAFKPSMHADVLERMELKEELQRAVDEQEFVLQYQPFVALKTGEVVGVEALVRWNHPTRGLVAPGEFIPLAEETGLILPIGRFVMREACITARYWQRKYPTHPPLRISVNLSARQLQQPGLVEEVAQTLHQCDLNPESLILEITESVLMQDTDATIDKLQQLRNLGVKLAIDDFGTGYSSLSYLKSFPIDILKIAKSFVDGVGNASEESALARAIIKLGGTLRLQTVAEGVELPEQRDQLRELHCNMGQGYYFARPLDSIDMDALLAADGLGEWPAIEDTSTFPVDLYTSVPHAV